MRGVWISVQPQTVQERFQHKIVTGVIAAVTDPAGRVLFIKQQRGPFAGAWLCPGGGIEPGETATDAVVREVYEETGITVQEPVFVGVYEMRGTWSGGPYHLLMMGFLARGSGEIPQGFTGDHVDGARWAHVSEAPLHSTDLKLLTDAGLAAFGEGEIASALAADGITLRVFR